MSLLLIDGCDHGNPALKGWVGTLAVQTTARTGARSYGATSANNSAWQLASADEHATLVMGVAVESAGTSGLMEVALRSDSGATTHVTVALNYADGYIRIYRGTSGGTLLATSAAPLSSWIGSWHYLEVKGVLSDTVGSVEVRVDGSSTPFVSVSGVDTKNAGTKTVFDNVQLLTTIGTTALFDDIYLCNGAGTDHNDFLGDCSVATLTPDSTTTANWVGSDGNSVNNEQLIDETPFSDADYVGSSTVGAIDHYTMSDLPAGSTVKGVAATIRAFKSDAGTRTLRARIMSGASNVQKDLVLATGAAYDMLLAANDPNTGAAWTEAAVNAAGVEIEVV